MEKGGDKHGTAILMVEDEEKGEEEDMTKELDTNVLMVEDIEKRNKCQTCWR